MRDVPGVLVTAGRLLARHWPAFLVLAVAGAAVRAATLWAAVALSNRQSELAQLLLILAPLGYLLPVIWMLHLCRGSLPNLQGEDDRVSPTEGRQRRLVDIAVSVLVPFLAVYVSYGFLEQDILQFRNEAASEELGNTFVEEVDFRDRLGLYPVQVAAMIVVVAWVLRWALGRFEHRTKFLALAVVGAVVELYYTSQLAGQGFLIKTDGMEWLARRRAYQWFQDGYDALLGRLGFLADPVAATVDAGQAVLGSFDSVVVVPIAWLTVGAVVLGHQLAEGHGDGATRAGDDADDADDAEGGRRGGLLRSFGADLRGRFGAFFDGLRLLSAAGLYPMLVFSLVFVVALRLPGLLVRLSRVVVGPTEHGTYLAFQPYEQALGLVASMVVVAPLLAAAVDWLVSSRRAGGPAARRAPEAATTAAPR
ncbi:hypothetical protein [Nocardioides sp. SYSU D00038]|uniref:hypothetical protein n=1 Tax=Nocardioides sp. SYSU D00038 TaxID=2812554 RepID=UPI001966DC2F|nr:hypothetical protein [Nocardioides sp. SYSU D00038]